MRPRTFGALCCLFAFIVPALALGQCPPGVPCSGGACSVSQQPAWMPQPIVVPKTLQRQDTQIAQCTYPALVRVNFIAPGNSEMEVGSGAIVDRMPRETAIVLTCAHGYKALMSVRVDLQDGRRFQAAVLGVDSINDLCVLAIQDPGIKPMSVAVTPPQVGDKVYMAGFAQGTRYMGNWGTLAGWAGASKERPETFIRTTCQSEEGCSGGPILNSEGRVVGTVTGFLGGSIGPCLPKVLPQMVITRMPYQVSVYVAAPVLPWRKSMVGAERANGAKLDEISAAVNRPVPIPPAPAQPTPVPANALPVDLSPVLQGQQEQAELLRTGFAELSRALAAKAEAKPETLKEKIHTKLEDDAEEGGLKGKIAEKLLRWEERGSTMLWVAIAAGIVLLVYWHKNKHGPVAGVLERMGKPELAEREEAIMAKVEARVKGAVATVATANPAIGLAVSEAEKVEQRIKDLIEARLAPSPGQVAAPPAQSTLVPPSVTK